MDPALTEDGREQGMGSQQSVKVAEQQLWGL